MVDNFIKIGFTKKAYGAKGQIKVVIQDQYIEDFARSEHIFITLMGKPAPFFIESIEANDEILLKLDDIHTPEEAKLITSKDLFLREVDLSALPIESVVNELDYSWIEGFTLFDIEHGEIGKIQEIQEFPQQEMAVVTYQGNEVFIPLHPDLIESINELEKKITLRLPEGLLDL